MDKKLKFYFNCLTLKSSISSQIPKPLLFHQFHFWHESLYQDYGYAIFVNNKVVLATVALASILAIGMINPVGLVFAHVNVCSPSNDHDKDGVPFSALWAAVCDLQSQIDNLQNQINNLHGGTGGAQSNINAKFVKLTPATGCGSTLNGATIGWCPNPSSSEYLIYDSAVGPNSVIETSTVNPSNPSNVLSCPVQSINYTEGPPNSGFLILCNYNVNPTTELNYVILNPATNTPVTCTPPNVLQNGVCVPPTPVTCTPPKVLDNDKDECITPTTHDDDKDKKQSNDSQFSNYKNENKH